MAIRKHLRSEHNGRNGHRRSHPTGRTWKAASSCLLKLGFDACYFLPVRNDKEDRVATLACFWQGKAEALDADERERIGEIARLAGLAVERAHLDETLRQQRRFFETLGSSMPGAVFQFVRRPDGTAFMPYVSPAAEELFGIDPADFEKDAAALTSSIHPEDRSRFAASVRASARDMERWTWEGRLLRRESEETCWVRAASQPIRRPDGGVLWNGLLMDITEQKNAERDLRATEQRYRTLFENAGDAITVVRGHVFADCNQQALDLFDCKEERDLLGHTPWEFSPRRQPDGRLSKEKARAVIREAAKGEAQTFHWQHTTLEGRPFTAEVSLTRLRAGEELLIFAILRDVTERRAAEEALRASEKKYRRLIEQTADWVWETDCEGRLTYVSPQVEAITGHVPENVLGQSIYDFLKNEDGARFREEVLGEGDASSAKPFSRFESTLIDKDGAPVYLETSGAPIYDEGGRYNGYHGISRDVTDRIERREQLERQAVRLGIVNEVSTAILEASAGPEAVAEAALGRLEALVPFFSASVTEYDLESGEELSIARRTRRGAPQALRRSSLFEGGPGPRAVVDGELYYCNDLTAVADRSAVQKALLDWGVRSYVLAPAMASGTIVGALKVTRTEPHAFSSEDLSVLKEVARLVAVALQQARYRQALVAAKDKAEEMNRLKSAFLANMSHEIRTPLTAILGFSDLLAETAQDEERELLQMIQESGRRLQNTLTSVLDLAALESNSKRIELKPVDAREAAREAVLATEPQTQEKALSLRVETPDEPVLAKADRNALTRVVANLVSNAVKFTNEGEVTVRVAPSKTSSKEWAKIEVQDTGIGMDPAFTPHLFEEFKQESEGLTRGYEGTGLGLAITKRLVELMQGEIEVESEKGVGSTFSVRLPAFDATRT